MNTPGRRRGGARGMSVAVAVLLATALGACGGGSSSSAKSLGSPESPAKSDGTGYVSTSFVVPFAMAPPGWLDQQPKIEQPHFATWEAADQPAVRFLAPVNVFRPGGTGTTDLPSDYVGYLLGQAKSGGHFADQVQESVDGQPAVLVTATTDRALDGFLGCPTATTPAPDCFGLQPDLALRIAVVNVHGQILLIWLRMDKNADSTQSTAQTKAFDDMLATVRFSDRDPAPATSSAHPTPGPSAIDGNYRMSISWPKVTTADGRCVGGPEGTSDRTVYELSLDHGQVELSVRIGGAAAPSEPAFSGTFRILDNKFVFGDTAVPLTTDYSFDGKLLTLTNMPDGPCGARAIWTTKPWVRE